MYICWRFSHHCWNARVGGLEPPFALSLPPTLVSFPESGFRHIPRTRLGDSISRAVCCFKAALAPTQAGVPTEGGVGVRLLNVQSVPLGLAPKIQR